MNTELYNIGKNYILSCDIFNINELSDENLLIFLRGYIELNSKLLMPNSNGNFNPDSKKYSKTKIYKDIITKDSKYPILILLFRKQDKEFIDKLINYINLHKIRHIVYIQTLTYNKVKYNYKIIFESYNVLNILSKIYPPNIDKNEIDEYLYNIYMTLSNYKYINYDSDNDTLFYLLPKCQIKLLHKSAIMPYKKNASDIGYNLSIIKRYKTISDKITIYDTGIQLLPQYGYYFELIPKFILSTSGYILGNITGVINPIQNDDTKTLLITLIKIDKSLPDIKLPFTCCKIILKEMIHYELS
jgi:hypothetical protein